MTIYHDGSMTGMMASHVSDKILWLCLGMFLNINCVNLVPELICLGVSLFFAVRGIAADLRSVNELTEIKNDDSDDKIISEGTEDGTEHTKFSLYTCFILDLTQSSPQTRHAIETLQQHKLRPSFCVWRSSTSI